MKNTSKPKPEEFGFAQQMPCGDPDEGGWQIEGGEEAYSDAVEKWLADFGGLCETCAAEDRE